VCDRSTARRVSSEAVTAIDLTLWRVHVFRRDPILKGGRWRPTPRGQCRGRSHVPTEATGRHRPPAALPSAPVESTGGHAARQSAARSRGHSPRSVPGVLGSVAPDDFLTLTRHRTARERRWWVARRASELGLGRFPIRKDPSERRRTPDREPVSTGSARPAVVRPPHEVQVSRPDLRTCREIRSRAYWLPLGRR
jgi:hypothetical protein